MKHLIQLNKNHLSKMAAFFLSALLLFSTDVRAQSVDLENMSDNFGKGNRLKVNGGLSAGIIGYAGNSEANRNPYTWNVAGNLNFRLFDLIDLPFSMNISNANRELRVPTTPSRLSVHPTYKGVTAHIGDVNMTYSPYSLNGHQFTGVGVDVFPEKSKFRFSAMGGRFQQSVEYDSSASNFLAAYERWGYGGKIQYIHKVYEVGVNIFTAKDKISSLNTIPDSIGITPMQNMVGSADFAFRPFKGFEFRTEVALSALTQDMRENSEVVKRTAGLYNPVFPENNSTAYHAAQNLSLKYSRKKNTIGLRYERIDPGYRTLGAYFFANDLENLTLDFGKVMMKNKLTLMARAGVQRDDIDNNKSGRNQRFVGSINSNFTPNHRFNLGVNYSNFRTFMRIKSQFQFINQVNEYVALDTFNFTQISQNLNVFTSVMIKEKDSTTQTLMANFSLQDAYSEQGGSEHAHGTNIFYNSSLSHVFQNLRMGFDFTTSYFFTYNTIEDDKFITQGPSMAVGKRLFQEALRLMASVNYNHTSSSNSAIDPVDVINTRIGLGLRMWKKHNLNISVMQQNRGSSVSQIGSVNYFFSF